MATFLTTLAILVAVGVLLLIAAAVAIVMTEKPESHWIEERKKMRHDAHWP